MIYAYEFVCRDFILRTTRKIVGPPDSMSWWSCGPLLKKVCVKPWTEVLYHPLPSFLRSQIFKSRLVLAILYFSEITYTSFLTLIF